MDNKLNKAELINMVQKIMDADGTEREIDEWICIVNKNVPCPNVSDFIFYPDNDDDTSEIIVNRALAYKPIGLE